MLTDKFGIEINIGDTVAVPLGSRSLGVGTVSKMNKYVTVNVDNGRTLFKPPNCVIIINEQMKYNKNQYAELFI